MEISESTFYDFKQGRIESLYTHCYASLAAFAARYLTDSYAMMAEDCVQEAVIKAYESRDMLESPLQTKNFMYVCVRNSCISMLRKLNSHNKYLQQIEQDQEQEASAAIIEQETLDRLHEAINELPEKYRQIFDLSYEQGLKQAEVAELLGITIDGVAKRKARMVSMLREKFKNDEAMLLAIALLLS